ncbi:DUF1080 domain-containing protein [Gilvimarinus sp. SDUM040013]|uniref:DUF1080 domain-containing protein n=1 Tax=Gilvimarinus gilvus TaxID=3058038 RepID=A0ABU4S4M0_9GAMM|nr:DUF1080 domain-containing protein [Gilvimarinus sp. SDUM040013]MDO3384396.1 DUF1080 domain-containing protein [Gilvimarinus sp. SDUM040013]MDX6851447.1 DUF1080 domain-containing protein [Gilvimarinus sp. SDUM040013]
MSINSVLHKIKNYPLIALSCALSVSCSQQDSTPQQSINDPTQEQWQTLFNGQDLDDWIIKIAGYPLNENALDTFQVEDGKLIVNYDQYDEFEGRNGHIFYKEPFSYFRIKVEYRFVGEQAKDAPGWAWRNNGIMYHAQSPESMAFEQGYPACMEVQLLGGNGTDKRHTSNLVTPGSHSVYQGEFREDHIIESSSKTYHGDIWVEAEVEVHGGDLAVHYVEGEEVIRYSGMQLDDGTPLTQGYIALQAESAPIEFRKVEILNLKGCMDSKATNYKTYYVANDIDSCEY